MGFCTFLHFRELWSRFLSWEVLFFSFLSMKKFVVTSSFWNYQFPFHCLRMFLPFLRGLSILNSPCLQRLFLSYRLIVLSLQCSQLLLRWETISWSSDYLHGIERKEIVVEEAWGKWLEQPQKARPWPGALEQQVETWGFWGAWLEY